MARPRIPSEERVFSLVLALVASAEGLTKHDLLSSVYGYSDRYRDERQRVALERQFERDKEQLRQLGIPVETIDSPGESGNNQLLRYRISKAAMQVPEGLSFSDRELMMLRMAVLAWREGSLTEDARRAAMKLESLGSGADVPSPGMHAGFGTSEPAAPALLQAIEAREIAEFAYQLPQRDAPLLRRVYPLQLHRFEGRWHLIAYDLERDAARVFLLARIAGKVVAREPRAEDTARPRAAAALVDAAVAELEQLQRDTQVTLRVTTHSRADARFSPGAQVVTGHDTRVDPAGDAFTAPEGTRILRFGTVDLYELAAVVAGYGAEVEVLDPPALRAETLRLLRAAADAHSGAGGGSAPRPDAAGSGDGDHKGGNAVETGGDA